MTKLSDHLVYIYHRIIKTVITQPSLTDKLIIGASYQRQAEFVSTDIDTLDITRPLDWIKLINPNTLTHILSEHVFEHLTTPQLLTALKCCYNFLKPGGRLRIAVPDKNRRDPIYVQEVKPPHNGHFQYFNHIELKQLLSRVGFSRIIELEYFTQDGKFIHKNWNPQDGLIRRSYRYDKQKKFKLNNMYYTSLIIDAIK
jgi:predicted SAM-dependent methyltransferase